MQARIVGDEALPGPPGSEPARSVTIEVSEAGWRHVESFTVSGVDQEEVQVELEGAVREMLRKAGKPDEFDWA